MNLFLKSFCRPFSVLVQRIFPQIQTSLHLIQYKCICNETLNCSNWLKMKRNQRECLCRGFVHQQSNHVEVIKPSIDSFHVNFKLNFDRQVLLRERYNSLQLVIFILIFVSTQWLQCVWPSIIGRYWFRFRRIANERCNDGFPLNACPQFCEGVD